ncbi:hypothetical protein C8R46DRAFT_1234774 [Mycena filopes]|nr:hypothetical protein C8R46DRAFT_1234774 [Mycena filopes]
MNTKPTEKVLLRVPRAHRTPNTTAARAAKSMASTASAKPARDASSTTSAKPARGASSTTGARASKRASATTDVKPPKGASSTEGNKENVVLADTLIVEEVESKFNVEGCNTADIVYARRENDKNQALLQAQAAELERLKNELAALSASKDKIGPSDPSQANKKKRTARKQSHSAEGDDQVVGEQGTVAGDAGDAPPAKKQRKAPAGTSPIDERVSGRDNEGATGGGEDTDDTLDALARLAKENEELRCQLAAVEGAGGAQAQDGPAPGSIPRPSGVAGTDYNIQDKMGLGKGETNGRYYKSIMRTTREVVIQARVNWEKPWADVSADVKAKVFAVAAERHPILARYFNSWATEDLVKQYIKNRRQSAYRSGELEVPAKYRYLKANAAMRNPTGRRGRQNKRAKVDVARKRAVKKAAATSTSKGKGKARAMAVDSDSDDSEEDTGAWAAGSDESELTEMDEDEDDPVCIRAPYCFLSSQLLST